MATAADLIADQADVVAFLEAKIATYNVQRHRPVVNEAAGRMLF